MEDKQTTFFLDEFKLEKYAVLSGHYMNFVIQGDVESPCPIRKQESYK